jgi:hypothetical protein
MFESTDRLPNTLTLGEEEAAAKMVWAAIERLPTYECVRHWILNNVVSPSQSHLQQIDVTNVPLETRTQLVQRLVGVTDEDNEHFLQKLHQRLQRFGF